MVSFWDFKVAYKTKQNHKNSRLNPNGKTKSFEKFLIHETTKSMETIMARTEEPLERPLANTNAQLQQEGKDVVC